jgi:murein DD-endopeptidase MepM/ murein hydrolase activator NlpD
VTARGNRGGHHWAPVRPRTAALIGALGAALAIGLLAPSHTSAAADPSAEATELERQRQRDHGAELARKLDPPSATTEQLIAAVTVLDQQIRSQIARSAELERARVDAERRVAENRDELGRMQPELRNTTNELQVEAVRMYLDPAESDNSLRLMQAEYFDEAERRRVFVDVVHPNTRELVEKVRKLRAKHDDLQTEANQARDEADARKRENEKLFGDVVDGQAKLKALQTEWGARVNRSGKQADNIGDTSELDRAIAEQLAKLPKTAPVPVSSNGRMIRPISGTGVNDPFGYRSSRGRRHEGVDLKASTGTPVLAAQAGRVVHSGWEGAYGYSVVLDHGYGLQTRYAHLSRLGVNYGANVGQGAQIGLSGASGSVTGPHLHFEVIKGGVRVNPSGYIPL